MYGGFPWVFRGTNLRFQFGTYVKPRPTQESTVPKYQSSLRLFAKNNKYFILNMYRLEDGALAIITYD